MYRKRYENFLQYRDKTTKTSRNQRTRFQRNCKRVFNWMKDDPALTLDDHISRARQHRFLLKY
ncbi:hypothetical protein RhiirA4_394890 [Rhizophagus irregularis]|uniref:DUF8211 domain-containing protein n=1 Tax=Rhizophagus irregularis TaxID=588596 RepID=A0A2I1G203_9GLOM|nr:hypothetical protein RhiirA4_394890 [Rhizophagus irregularis]